MLTTKQMQAVLYHARRRRQAASDFKKFASLIASPVDIGTVDRPGISADAEISFPAPARLGFVSDSPCGCSDFSLAAWYHDTGYPVRFLNVPVLEPTVMWIFPDVFPKLANPVVGVAGTAPAGASFTIYLLDGMNRRFPIMTGTTSE